MAPGNNGRHPGHTGTIPKTKVRNNCNVPQEAVTPTRRDMTTNLVTTSLDWVPVSEYNTRSNYSQSRKPTNNSSDHELNDLDNSVSFESGFGRFVPVRPQPRALPLNVQNRDNLSAEQHDDGTGSSISGHSSLHPYGHQMQNGLIPHSNHAAAAVMIVNPTTPNAVAGNVSQPFNAPNQNRNNLTRNLNPARNNFEASSHTSNNNTTPPNPNSRTGTKTVNLINNMYEQGQGSFNNLNENNHVHRESARALGEAIVAACPDAAAVERRLGQIREYIRVTSSLVDTMRNSEDEAFIEHTKEEYDELVEMVLQLKESESKLEQILIEKSPENVEVPAEETDVCDLVQSSDVRLENETEVTSEINLIPDKTCNIKNNNDNNVINHNLKKVTNIENEQLNKSMHNIKVDDDNHSQEEKSKCNEILTENIQQIPSENTDNNECSIVEVMTVESLDNDSEVKKDDQHLNDMLRKNILSCFEKVARIEEMKKTKDSSKRDNQDVVTRPVSAQSNGSTYSDNELWQNEIKNKMELSQMRLTALKQQQKRLLKYQEEAKQQLEEMNRERQSQEIQPSTSHDNFPGMQNQAFSVNYGNPNRMYAANQIGVATTLPHSSEALHGQQSMSSNVENEHRHSNHSAHSQDERFSHREGNIASGEEAVGGALSEAEDDEVLLNERGRMLQVKLRELQLKKQHMENLVSEFQKLQRATRLGSTHNTYSSSGEESGDEEPSRKCNKSGGNIKNEDPFKLMEIKAIKTALQKTKDLMRSVENYEAEQLSSGHDETFREMANQSNIHDNKSEGGGSMGGWSNDGSMCRVRNTLPQRHKFTNEQHSQQHHPQQLQQLQQQQHPQHLQHLQQQHQQLQQQQQHQQQQLQHHQQQQLSHETNIASLQELAQELRMETEKIIGERARIKDMISNKEVSRKQKKVNEEVRPGPSGAPGPMERRQMQLRAMLADKQRELEALLNKEKVICSAPETHKPNPESHTASIVNQSYNSEQEEPDSRSEQLLLESQNSRETENFRGGGDSGLGGRSMAALPPHLASTYGSDSDSVSRNKSNQRNRTRRRQLQERQPEENNVPQSNNANQNMRHDPRAETSNVNMLPPISQNVDNPGNMPYAHLPPPGWNATKSNQDMRTNQFTQNSHSQTMDRLLGTPQMSFPPSMPFNMMMPYGMLGGCGGGCGCAAWGAWGAWCGQQLALQQRELLQLRDQLNHLEERWRAETASHTLNNQVPPGNRANNYWDNFRSYSRQNLLSANNKTNADGHLGVGPAHNPHPLVDRSHNTLHRTTSATSPCITPKRNTNAVSSSQNSTQPPLINNEDTPNRHSRRNVAYERSLSFSSAPDVLNLNQSSDNEATAATNSRNIDENSAATVSNININRQEVTSHSFRNLNISNPIPEIIQSHSNNLNTSANSKKKSSSKLPAKNSTIRRNYTLDYSQTSNINIASTSEMPNPNLASTSSEVEDKATSKLFDLLRENVYSEVTTLIGVNESHPDFLIQLFRELQLISSDTLRQRVLQSIRNVLSQYSSIMESHGQETDHQENRAEAVSTTSGEPNNYIDCNSLPTQNVCTSTMQIDNKIVRFLLLKSDEFCTSEFLETLASHILSSITADRRHSQQSKRRLLDILSKYEGLRVSDVSSDIIENLPMFVMPNIEGEPPQLANELPESSILQDVAGSLNLFSASDSQLHQINACPYMWPGHVHMDIEETELNDNSARSSQDDKVDLINCSEMHNGDLAEADQTCRAEMDNGCANDHDSGGNIEALPDVVDTEEVTPTEAEAEWLGLDRVPTRLHMEESSEKQKD